MVGNGSEANKQMTGIASILSINFSNCPYGVDLRSMAVLTLEKWWPLGRVVLNHFSLSSIFVLS